MKNNLWNAPPRLRNPQADKERKERERDKLLIQSAKNFNSQVPEIINELARYDNRPTNFPWILLD